MQQDLRQTPAALDPLHLGQDAHVDELCESGTELLAGVLQFFSLGLFSFCAFQLFLRAFYAMQDTRTPALINLFAVGLNTAVNFLYYRYLGVEGLALGHAETLNWDDTWKPRGPTTSLGTVTMWRHNFDPASRVDISNQ